MFGHRYPAVRVELQFMSTGLQMEALRECRIQAAFLILPVNDPSFTLEAVKKTPIWIALPKRHPLTRHKYVQLAELADQQFILFARRSSPGLHDVITSMCRNAGFSLNVVHEVNHIIAAFTLVAAGLGLAFCAADDAEIVARRCLSRDPRCRSSTAVRRRNVLFFLSIISEKCRGNTLGRTIWGSIGRSLWEQAARPLAGHVIIIVLREEGGTREVSTFNDGRRHRVCFARSCR